MSSKWFWWWVLVAMLLSVGPLVGIYYDRRKLNDMRSESAYREGYMVGTCDIYLLIPRSAQDTDASTAARAACDKVKAKYDRSKPNV